jgi:nitrogenase molybdenum-iron protein NifN
MIATEKFVETPTTNACKLCAPLGASLVFKGIRNCVPLIHGSQGCATYIRRYLISHFREPVDIASSSFAEDSTIFGGGKNFYTSLDNINAQYSPEAIGICTSCLSETIGDDVGMFLNEYKKARPGEKLPAFITASTPSYRGTHMEGFHAAVKAALECLAEKDAESDGRRINVFPGFVSPADMRYLKEILEDFALEYMMLPDYSETLDSTTWTEYRKIPPGGTPVEAVKKAGSAGASIQFGRMLAGVSGPGDWLEKKFGVKSCNMGMPVGIKETDEFFKTLKELAGIPVPVKYIAERGRLVDAYIDGHKYLFGKRAIVYGEEDLVVGLSAFLSEIGIHPVICATGGENPGFAAAVETVTSEARRNFTEAPMVLSGVDFEELKNLAEEVRPDILIGNSKGYYISRAMNIPLLRCGFPVHDRVGAQRLLHLGYRGTQQLFDALTNALMQYKQDKSPIGYKYV